MESFLLSRVKWLTIFSQSLPLLVMAFTYHIGSLSFVLLTLVFSASAFVIKGRTKDSGIKKTAHFWFEGTGIEGFVISYSTKRKFFNFLGRKSGTPVVSSPIHLSSVFERG